MPKTKSPPVNLDKYLAGRNHKYMNYQQAARHYGLLYWRFVKVEIFISNSSMSCPKLFRK